MADITLPRISVIVPVYKEEANIAPFLARTVPVLERIGAYELIFVLDPSPDRTEEMIENAIKDNPRIGLIVMSRRFGQPAATMAGILECQGQTCVVIDVDLQDPPELIADLYARHLDGFDVVYATRTSRKGETWVKRAVSAFGYWVINKLSDVRIPRNTGDFRLMTRKVIEELRQLPERHGFLRGLVAFVGFRQAAVEYDRDERAFGQGNYNRLLGSMRIGLNGLIGFSTAPLSLLMWIGIAVSCLSVVGIFFMLVTFVAGVRYPLGIPTITVLILFLGGAQLAGIGLLGEYVGRIYEEVRHRPRYIAAKRINLPGPDGL